jgi:hypothetical protein
MMTIWCNLRELAQADIKETRISLRQIGASIIREAGQLPRAVIQADHDLVRHDN